MSDFAWLVLVLLSILSLPALVYASVKLGVIGFYRGRQWFEFHQRRDRNGEK